MNILIKPASSLCNLRCGYCFYHDEANSRQTQSFGMMSINTLENIVSKALAEAKKECTFGFQGGEPTLAGLGFFRELIQLQQKHNTRGLKINNALQTNGTLIDDEWAQFFADNGFLIGLSLDGNRETHDRYRIDTDGGGTFTTVRRAAKILEKHEVQFNVLCVVTAQSAGKAKSLYRFFMHNGFEYQQYIACMDQLGQTVLEYSLSAGDYSVFLKDMFDVWYEDRKKNVFVYNRYFENLAGILKGVPPESCDMTGHCSVQYAIESDGGVYPCDFYMLDDYKLGNINTDSFEDIDRKRENIGFIEESKVLPDDCKDCRWLALCRNGCKRYRDSEGKSIFCESYKEFFEYAGQRLAELVR